MQSSSKRQQFPSRPEVSNANITSAVGLEETAGRLRARRYSLFTQTILLVTGLICIAFLLGSLVQAWSNSQLEQKVQVAQQQLKQAQDHHKQLLQTAGYYKDPSVIENEARQQLGYVRVGDHLVIVVNSNDQKSQNTQQSPHVAGKQGFWQDWWQTFLGN